MGYHGNWELSADSMFSTHSPPTNSLPFPAQSVHHFHHFISRSPLFLSCSLSRWTTPLSTLTPPPSLHQLDLSISHTHSSLTHFISKYLSSPSSILINLYFFLLFLSALFSSPLSSFQSFTLAQIKPTTHCEIPIRGD